jgi:hypothetical protein
VGSKLVSVHHLAIESDPVGFRHGIPVIRFGGDKEASITKLSIDGFAMRVNCARFWAA